MMARRTRARATASTPAGRAAARPGGPDTSSDSASRRASTSGVTGCSTILVGTSAASISTGTSPTPTPRWNFSSPTIPTSAGSRAAAAGSSSIRAGQILSFRRRIRSATTRSGRPAAGARLFLHSRHGTLCRRARPEHVRRAWRTRHVGEPRRRAHAHRGDALDEWTSRPQSPLMPAPADRAVERRRQHR